MICVCNTAHHNPGPLQSAALIHIQQSNRNDLHPGQVDCHQNCLRLEIQLQYNIIYREYMRVQMRSLLSVIVIRKLYHYAASYRCIGSTSLIKESH